MMTSFQMSVCHPDTQAILQKLAAELDSLPKDVTILAKPALTSILELTQSSNLTHAAAIDFLKQWLSRLDSSSRVLKKINAHDISRAQIVEIFNLDYPSQSNTTVWSILDDSLVDVPNALRANLRHFAEAFYGDESEATCRIAIDIILIQCRIYVRRKYQMSSQSSKGNSSLTNPANPSTPVKSTAALPCRIPNKPFMLFPEATMSVEIENESGRFLVSGRADWALGYVSTGNEGALLSAIEAKKISDFGKGEYQLVAYLAIMRENRKRAKKINSTTQGFYSDGQRFAFVHITEDGTVKISGTFDIRLPGALKYVFSFIISMMETAMKSTLTTTPTKPGLQRVREVSNFQDEGWTKIYALIDESVCVPDYCNPDDAIDLS